MSSCACGCSEMTTVSNAEEACDCGCACCAEEPKTAEDEILELTTLRARIDQRLGELKVSVSN